MSNAVGFDVWRIGDVIDGLYEVKGVLGEGGFGRVYQVHHRNWNTDLAAKCLRPTLVASEKHRRDFVRECEGWIELGLHPNIVSCYYVRALGGTLRIFSEFMDGGSLAQWIAAGRVEDWKLLLDLAIQTCDGLAYAHEKGLVHRDVKPANCLMTQDGSLKITDFGIASGLGRVSGNALPMVEGIQWTGTMTMEGGVCGSPPYMPPEQWEPGQTQVGPWSDIYAFGVMLFEMACGERPFDEGHESPLVVKARHQTAEIPDPTQVRDDIPNDLSALISGCLNKEPSERPSSFAEIRASLVSIHEQAVGQPYPRPAPSVAKDTADSLNNRAVSLLDSGKTEAAEKLFEDTLGMDAHHLEAIYNHGVILWHSGRMTDQALLTQLAEAGKSYGGNWLPHYLMGLVHLARKDVEAAIGALEEAVEFGGGGEVGTALSEAQSLLPSTCHCVRTLERNGCGVRSMCLSEDGRWALLGSHDKTLLLWDVVSGKCLHGFEGHTDSVCSVCLSADVRLALSGSQDKTLRLWEVTSGKCLRVFEGHTDLVRSVCLSTEGRLALSGSYDHTLRLWDVASGKCLRVWKEHKSWVNSVCLSRDGRVALSGSNDKTLRLWDIANGKCIRTFEGHTKAVLCVCLSRDGRWALSGSGDHAICLWDAANGKCLRTFEGHTSAVYDVWMSADACWMLSAGPDNTLRLWDATTGQCARTFDGPIDQGLHGIHAACLSSDGRWALSGSNNEPPQLWGLSGICYEKKTSIPIVLCKVKSGEEMRRLEAEFKTQLSLARGAFESGQVNAALESISVAIMLPGHGVSRACLDLSAAIGQRCRKKRFRDAWCRRIFYAHTGGVVSVFMSTNGQWALSGGYDGTLKLWNVAEGNCLRSFRGNENPVSSVCLSNDGRWVLGGSFDGTLRLWDARSGECLRTFDGHKEPGSTVVCLSKDGRWAISGSHGDHTLRLWNIERGECLHIFKGHTIQIESVCLSADDRSVLGGGSSYQETLALWDVASGQCVHAFGGHSSFVKFICLNADGRWALSGGYDKILRLWDLTSGKCLRTLDGYKNHINSLCLSGDGRWAFGGSGDHALCLWEVADGKCLRTFEGHTESVDAFCLSGDGRWAISGGLEETLRLWELDWEYEFPGWSDWDDGAFPYLQNFLTLHTPYAAELSQDRAPTEQEVTLALTRRGQPHWMEEDFKNLLYTLGCAGYGWLRPEGVRRKLEEIAADWTEPPPLSIGPAQT
ncbi:MAG: protein kinase [Verrucomicrobia bacterium]|nr:protein kinase [Verrucomicrobiota bacterium]